jgi:hypothetical protein
MRGSDNVQPMSDPAGMMWLPASASSGDAHTAKTNASEIRFIESLQVKPAPHPRHFPK